MKYWFLIFLFLVKFDEIKSQTCTQRIQEIETAFENNQNPINEIRDYELECSNISAHNLFKLHVFRVKQYRTVGKFKAGLNYAERVLDDVKFQENRGELLLELSIIHFLIGEHEKTIPICYSILKIAKVDQALKGKALSMLANSHARLGNDQYAEKYFKRCLYTAKQLKDSSLISVAYNGLGLIEYAKGRRKNLLQASSYLENSIEFSTGSTLSSKNNLAAVYYQLKDFDKAGQLFRDCLDLSQEIGDTSTAITVLNNLGSIALIRKDPYEAAKYLNESLELHRLFSRGEDPPTELLLSLSDLNYAQGNYKMSRDYYEQYTSGSLGLLNAERNQAMIEMQEKYEALNKKKEIDDLKISKQRIELSNLRLQNFIAFMSICFIVFLLTLFILIYLKRKKDRREKMIELQRAGLEASENEKLRISRELHDSMGGTFTVLSLLLNQKHFDQPDDEVFKKMREVIDVGTGELRQLCRDIYPQSLKISGLDNSLKDLFDTLNSRQNVVQFELEFEALDFTPGFSINMYRIAQELANNTLKYSQGDHAMLSGALEDGIFHVEYTDNGIGMNEKTLKIGVGLNSILERSRSYSGKVNFEKNKNASTGFFVSLDFNTDKILNETNG